jgi:hypothetical protein
MFPPGPVLFGEGCRGISELGGAVEGHRTMLDPLLPVAKAIAASVPVEVNAGRAAPQHGSGCRECSGQDRPNDTAAWALKLLGRSDGWACRSWRCRGLADSFAEGAEPGLPAVN